MKPKTFNKEKHQNEYIYQKTKRNIPKTIDKDKHQNDYINQKNKNERSK
jgi:hypothetical protein